MSVASPKVSLFDGDTRRIYLRCGVDTFHWIDDIYAEYLYKRATDESFRVWYPLIAAKGGEPRENDTQRESYTVLFQGAKVVPCNETGHIIAVGEIITDTDDQYPFDLSLNVVNPTITMVNPNFSPCYNKALEIETSEDTRSIEIADVTYEVELLDDTVDI